MRSKRAIFFIVCVALLVFIVGCSTQTVKEIKNPDFVGKTVSISGTVQNSFKIGQISGYQLMDKNNDTIAVSSENLPKEGTTKTAKGVLIKDTIFGYYIKE